VVIIYNYTGYRPATNKLRWEESSWIDKIKFSKQNFCINIYSSNYYSMNMDDQLDKIQLVYDILLFNTRNNYDFKIISNKNNYTYVVLYDEESVTYRIYCNGGSYYEKENLNYKIDYSSSYSENPSVSKVKGGKEKDAWICAQNVVENNLKSPSTAEFPWYDEEYVTYLGNERYQITAYVEADNSFGAHIKSNFIVTLTLTDSGYIDASCTIN
jgi:hypothetical protein